MARTMPGLHTDGLTRRGYCVVDNNYTERIFRNHTPLQNLKVTLAHEFFHVVQFSTTSARTAG